MYIIRVTRTPLPNPEPVEAFSVDSRKQLLIAPPCGSNNRSMEHVCAATTLDEAVCAHIQTGVETRGLTRDGNGDGSGDGNESSSRNGNGDEDGNEDGIGEGGGEAKKRK